MKPIDKLLAKISKKDKETILLALEALDNKKMRGTKLKNSKKYRLRVGSYRIFYEIYGGRVIIFGIRTMSKNHVMKVCLKTRMRPNLMRSASVCLGGFKKLLKH